MEARNVVIRAVMVLTLAGSAAFVAGCRAPKEPLYAQPVVVGETVLVRVTDAHVRGERVFVKTYMENRTDQAVTIDRNAIGLRLPDGRVLPRSGGRASRRHKPYVLGPGEGRDVFVDFRAKGERLDITQAFLVVDGVVLGDEKIPRKLGEVSLSSPHAGAAKAAPPTADEEAPAEAAEGADTEVEAEEEEPRAPAEQPEESWEIGGR